MTQLVVQYQRYYTTMTDNEIPVIVEPEAKENAYNMGFNRFNEPQDKEIGKEWFSHYTETAEWANSKLPDLRCMAGADDSGHGTYTQHREIVVVEYPDDRPMSGEKTNSQYLFDELVEQFRNGAYDKIEGNEQYESLEY